MAARMNGAGEPVPATRRWRDLASALPARVMWLTAAALPAPLASRFGAWLLGLFGPHLPKHRNVLANLQRVMPDAQPAVLQKTARGVWRNFGSVLFEYPHLPQIAAGRVEVTMPDSVRDLFAAGRPMMFMTGHLANWELLASYISRQGPGLAIIYSPRKNTALDAMIQRFRTRDGSLYLTKQQALRRLTNKHLDGRSVGLLPDVRVDSGQPLPLFGFDAPTTVSPPRLAARLGYPLVPVRAKRLGPARFELEFAEPMEPQPEYDGKSAAVELMTRFNALLEDWISERPDEWMCTKRRWPRTPDGAAGG